VTPLRALIIIIFLLENDVWGVGCYSKQYIRFTYTNVMFWVRNQMKMCT